MKPTPEQQVSRMQDNVNKVLSDMVSLALYDYETTGKGLIIEDKMHVTPELLLDLFEQHVKRIFNPETEVPLLSSIASFKLLKYDPKFELLAWDKPASVIYVKKNP